MESFAKIVNDFSHFMPPKHTRKPLVYRFSGGVKWGKSFTISAKSSMLDVCESSNTPPSDLKKTTLWKLSYKIFVKISVYNLKFYRDRNPLQGFVVNFANFVCTISIEHF